MSRTRTRLVRAAVVTAGALVLALTPAVAYAADTTRPSVSGTGGSAVSVTTGVIAVCAALYLSWKRGALLLVLLGIAAGAMLSGTGFAGTLSDLTDRLVHTVIEAVSGIFA